MADGSDKLPMQQRLLRGILGGIVGAVFVIVGLTLVVNVSPRIIGIPLGGLLVGMGAGAIQHSIYRKLYLGETDEAEHARDEAEARADLHEEMFERKVTCRDCGGRALPMPDTDGEYRCLDCDRTVSDDPHGVQTFGEIQPDWEQLRELNK